MEMVSSVPVAQQTMMMMVSLFSRSSVCFSVCLRMHHRTPKITKISWESMPPDPPTPLQWTAAGWPRSLLQLMTLPPRWKMLCTTLLCFNLLHSFLISLDGMVNRAAICCLTLVDARRQRMSYTSTSAGCWAPIVLTVSQCPKLVV